MIVEVVVKLRWIGPTMEILTKYITLVIHLIYLISHQFRNKEKTE